MLCWCRSDERRCECSPWFTGEDCSFALCPFGCSGHGTCMDGECMCDTGWDGYDCANEDCPGHCSGHGSCQVCCPTDLPQSPRFVNGSLIVLIYHLGLSRLTELAHARRDSEVRPAILNCAQSRTARAMERAKMRPASVTVATWGSGAKM
jgi:hypothetical protein